MDDGQLCAMVFTVLSTVVQYYISALVLLTAKPFIFALFAVWYQKKIGKI